MVVVQEKSQFPQVPFTVPTISKTIESHLQAQWRHDDGQLICQWFIQPPTGPDRSLDA